MRHFQYSVLLLATCLLTEVGVVSQSINSSLAEESYFVDLTTFYARALYRECNLSLSIPMTGKGKAAVNCVWNVVGKDRRSQEREMSEEEVGRFRSLLHKAALLSGDYVGGDSRGVDGILMTLKVLVHARDVSGRTAILVVSGNPSFHREGDRNSLLKFLLELEKELLERAKSQAKN